MGLIIHFSREPRYSSQRGAYAHPFESILPLSGHSKFAPFFITNNIYEKLLKYSLVPGG
jgi:hypothetical protein